MNGGRITAEDCLATGTFVRAIVASSVVVLAMSCGGGGSGSGSPDPGTPAPTASKIFVADSANAAIGSSPNSNPSAGTLPIDRIIAGLATQLTTSLFDLALDATNDRLYVADLRNILVFDNASTATGNVAPSRVLATIAAPSSYNGGIYLDVTGRRLYAGTNSAGATQTVQVFDNADTASFAAPARTIMFTIRNITDIAVDTTRDILYVYGADAGGFNQILAFNNASALNGTRGPDRTISFTDSGGTGPIGIFLDAAGDRLYVPSSTGTIAVFDAASTVNGSVTNTAVPPRIIDMRSVTTGYSVVFVEPSANRLYALDRNGVNIVANASTLDGALPLSAVRVLAPAGSAFRAIAVNR